MRSQLLLDLSPLMAVPSLRVFCLASAQTLDEDPERLFQVRREIRCCLPSEVYLKYQGSVNTWRVVCESRSDTFAKCPAHGYAVTHSVCYAHSSIAVCCSHTQQIQHYHNVKHQSTWILYASHAGRAESRVLLAFLVGYPFGRALLFLAVGLL